jgi:Holliday junction resolvase RusA-like endonuclease
MKWSFEIPGQPPSVNNMYTQIILRRGAEAPYRSVKKDSKVAAYQVGSTYIAKLSKPRGWMPTPGGQIRVYLDFQLKRDADCDNLMKALLDSIAIALGVNDRVFLPCTRSKTVGNKDPKVIVEIDDGGD